MGKVPMWVWIAGGVGALYIYATDTGVSVSQAATNVVNSGTNLVNSGTTYPYLVPGAPALPPAFDQQYVDQFILPAMIQANPNVGNPNYVLTQTDASNYMANYVQVAQWANNPATLNQPNNPTRSVLVACQIHWHLYGVPQKMTFLPLPWTDPQQWIPAPSNPKGAGGSNTLGWVATLGTIALGVLKILGPNDPEPVLDDEGIQIVVCGAAIAKDLLPMFAHCNPEMVDTINNKINSVIAQYN